MRAKSKIEFQIEISESPMAQAEWESAEDMLAEMVARAIAAEHPEWFGMDESVQEMEEGLYVEK